LRDAWFLLADDPPEGKLPDFIRISTVGTRH
jgi:hypothetical protein